MSTRCQIAIYPQGVTTLKTEKDFKKHVGLLYRHSDGYPGHEDGSEYGVLPDIVPFILLFIERRGYGDEYLAAWLNWHLINLSTLSNLKRRKELIERGETGGGILDYYKEDGMSFTGHGICDVFHVDIEYFYAIHRDCVDVYQCGLEEGASQWTLVKSVRYGEVRRHNLSEALRNIGLPPTQRRRKSHR